MSQENLPPPVPSVPAPAGAKVGGASSNVLASAESLGFVMDVPVELSVEIGRRVMRVADVLKLGPGSVLELDKLSGEPLDIYANKRLVARGEAVVIGERYGVRLKEVLVVDEPEKARGT
jgi:flagellar motor switch protein FliN/FliY